jgi:uncharacterized membrane protein YphA (DoxX/SURF4 family)
VQQHLGEDSRRRRRGGPANFSRGLERMGVPAPRILAFVVAGTEFLGGLMLISRRLTRLVALGLAVDVFFAIKLAHWKQG